MMGKRKIKIARIENKASRTVTFTKRRHGMFKKAGELCILCDAEVAILTFSPAGKNFTFGHPNVESLLVRYGFDPPTPMASSKPIISNGGGGGMGYWWEAVNIDDYADEGELRRLENALEGLRENVYARLTELSRTISAPPDLPNVGVSSSFAGAAMACRISEFLSGHLGGESPDVDVFGSLPQPCDI